jgi:hypothetical protein
MVKRYICKLLNGMADAALFHHPGEQFVSASDYDKLEAELEQYRVEGAYQRGYIDAIQNDGRTNPYPAGTESSRLWRAGFDTVSTSDAKADAN